MNITPEAYMITILVTAVVCLGIGGAIGEVLTAKYWKKVVKALQEEKDFRQLAADIQQDQLKRYQQKVVDQLRGRTVHADLIGQTIVEPEDIWTEAQAKEQQIYAKNMDRKYGADTGHQDTKNEQT